jgi:tetratricopeptide (TPR) repeat protein
VSVGTHGAPPAWEPDKLLALALSRPRQALAIAREILAHQPSASQAAVAHYAIGLVYRDFGNMREAIEEFKLARHCARKPAWVPPGYWPGSRGAGCRPWMRWCSAAVA